MSVALLVLLALGLTAGAALVAVSPGRPAPIVDERGRPVPGSVSEKSYIAVDGVEHGVFIKGRSADLPVLLYLHGGMPDYFLTATHPTGLDDHFLVVWWEQPGSGLSHAAAGPANPVTVERLVDDTLALTDHLRRRFGREKIWLMGHSGGTFIGVKAVRRAPERFHGYLAVAQITDQLESERQAHAWMLDRFRALGEERWVRRLEAAPVRDGTNPAYLRIRDPAMHRLGVGTMRATRSLAGGLFVPSLLFREYTVREKWRFWAAKVRSGPSVVWETIVSTDLREEVPEVGVPVYFLHGVHDRTCSYELARSWAAALVAPEKGFYSFSESAHSPIFEEPEEVLRVVRDDVLRGPTRLADPL